MKKYFFFFLFMIFSAINALSQPAESFLKKFSDSSKLKVNSHYYILQLNSKSDFTNADLAKNVVRALDEKTFIVEKRKIARSELQGNNFKALIPANNYWKLSPQTEQIILQGLQQSSFRFTISLKNKTAFDRIFKEKRNSLPGLIAAEDQQMISFISAYKIIEDDFLNDDEVVFIDVQTKKPQEELALPGFDFSVNKISEVHSRYPLINGTGQNVSIKEQFYDTSDIDLKGRLLASPLASVTITNHANFIATLIAGAGNSIYYAKGVAWAAGISSSSFDAVLPDESSYYVNNKITVQNHSYGSAIDNNYGLNAVAFDKSANDDPSLLHVFSAGNSGTETSTSGNYAGIEGFANLTGNYKMAKNTLLVGAEDSFGIVAPPGSRGPSFDGRLKPDIVAFEKNGTSESAAIVSGTALLLQQYYKSTYGIDLPSALAKAILINTADDVNTPGPDYATGFGSMNAAKAMNVIRDKTIFTGSVSQESTKNFLINIPPNMAKAKISLAWNDTAATAFAPKALVNDLDLKVTSTSSNQIWNPWVLSSFPDKDSLMALPVRKRDSLNNAEQITIDNPAAGDYLITVAGYDVPQGTQKFYVVFSFDTANSFQWHLPVNADFLEAGKENILRWASNISATADIEYTYASSNTWLPVAQSIDLSKNFYRWQTPDTVTTALLRMKIGDQYFYSDTFLVTSLLNPQVGFVCSDSVLLYWNKTVAINEYKIYQLGEKYMEPFATTTDTTVLLPVNILKSKYLAVAPVLPGGFTGIKSYAFDYALQGTGCYIKAFLTDLIAGSARLSLSLGTTFKVSNVSFEKLTTSGFTSVYSSEVNNQLEFSFDFQGLTRGINVFRARITLKNGDIIYSENGSVYYVENGKYLVFPVPVKRGKQIEIFTLTPAGELLQLFDAQGKIVFEKQIYYPHEFINTSTLHPGEYFYRITQKGLKVSSGKLLVL